MDAAGRRRQGAAGSRTAPPASSSSRSRARTARRSPSRSRTRSTSLRPQADFEALPRRVAGRRQAARRRSYAVGVAAPDEATTPRRVEAARRLPRRRRPRPVRGAALSRSASPAGRTSSSRSRRSRDDPGRRGPRRRRAAARAAGNALQAHAAPRIAAGTWQDAGWKDWNGSWGSTPSSRPPTGTSAPRSITRSASSRLRARPDADRLPHHRHLLPVHGGDVRRGDGDVPGGRRLVELRAARVQRVLVVLRRLGPDAQLRGDGRDLGVLRPALPRQRVLGRAAPLARATSSPARSSSRSWP